MPDDTINTVVRRTTTTTTTVVADSIIVVVVVAYQVYFSCNVAHSSSSTYYTGTVVDPYQVRYY